MLLSKSEPASEPRRQLVSRLSGAGVEAEVKAGAARLACVVCPRRLSARCGVPSWRRRRHQAAAVAVGLRGMGVPMVSPRGPRPGPVPRCGDHRGVAGPSATSTPGSFLFAKSGRHTAQHEAPACGEQQR